MKNIKIFNNIFTKEDVIINESSRRFHTMVLGPMGSGKTSQILYPMINEDIKNNESIIVIEPKGMLVDKVYAMAEYYKKEHICINFEAHKVDYYYNIFDEDLTTINHYLSNIFKDMNKSFALEPYSLDLNIAILLQGAKLIKETIVNPDLRDLNHLLNDKKFFKSLLYLNKDKDLNTDFELLVKYHEKKSEFYESTKVARGLINDLIKNKFLKSFLIPSNKREKLDFDKVINSNIILAINTSRGALRELGTFIDKLFMHKIQDTIFKKTDDSEIINYFYIDEPQLYMNKDFNTSIFTKRKVSLILSAQTLALFDKTVINSEVIKTNIENVIVSPSISKIDAEFYSKQMNTSPEGLIYRPFGEVVYSFKTKNGNENGIANIQYLERELNQELDKIIDGFYAEIKNKQ